MCIDTGIQAHGLAGLGLHFQFGKRAVLQGVDLHLAPGEVVSLLGANGAGKSTLLRLMLGFITPSRGLVQLDGQPLLQRPRREIARRIAYVPQAHALAFPYSVAQIVLLGRLPQSGLSRRPTQADRLAAESAMQRLGILPLAERAYTELSGGERQRVLIARALAQGARILLLDEPVSGLDYGNQIRLLQHLRSLADEGYAVLKTSHHPEHALYGSDRVVLLENGRITQSGAPDQVLSAQVLHALYGVKVQLLREAGGRTAGFYPLVLGEG